MTSNSPFDPKFCEVLEYALTQTLRLSTDPTLSKLWCDGILVPAPEWLEKKRVNDKRQIVTTAWIGTDGQTNFEMTIHLGKYALRRYAKGSELTDVIPPVNTSDWIDLDLANKKIDLYLL